MTDDPHSQAKIRVAYALAFALVILVFIDTLTSKSLDDAAMWGLISLLGTLLAADKLQTKR